MEVEWENSACHATAGAASAGRVPRAMHPAPRSPRIV